MNYLQYTLLLLIHRVNRIKERASSYLQYTLLLLIHNHDIHDMITFNNLQYTLLLLIQNSDIFSIPFLPTFTIHFATINTLYSIIISE
nr:MAG TPA: hypothetical protein [Caudoviricetes sp.]